MELLTKDPTDIQIKNQVNSIIEDKIETPFLKLSALIRFIAIYPEDIEKTKRIKSLIDTIENSPKKVNVFLDFVKTFYFDHSALAELNFLYL